MEEIKFFKEKMTFMLADMKEKEARAEALAEEVENLPDNLTRYNPCTYMQKNQNNVLPISSQNHQILK